MSIHKDKNGTYRVTWRVKDINTGKSIQRTKRGFVLKREAVEFEKSIDTNEKTAAVPSMTFRDAWKEWESFMDSSANTRQRHAEHFNKRFSAYLDKPMKEFTRPMLNAWRTALFEESYATRTKNATISFVKSVFKYYSDTYGGENAAVALRPFKQTDKEVMQEMNVWTVEEFNQFIQAVDNKIYRLFFELLFWTGMRRGEAIALCVSDLHDGVVDVHASQRLRSNGRTPTKTKTRRKVRIHDRLFHELLELTKGKQPSDYLFGDESGLAPTPIQAMFDAGIQKSGVKKIRLHDLRHSHATFLINSGANIVSVSKRLGHSSINQTLQTYTHLLDSTDDAMMDIIKKAD